VLSQQLGLLLCSITLRLFDLGHQIQLGGIDGARGSVHQLLLAVLLMSMLITLTLLVDIVCTIMT